MSRRDKLLERVLLGFSDDAIRFDDLLRLVRALGFDERTRGSHHIFTMEGIAEIINLQPKGAMAKAYQVKQVRQIVQKYGLGSEA